MRMHTRQLNVSVTMGISRGESEKKKASVIEGMETTKKNPF